MNGRRGLPCQLVNILLLLLAIGSPGLSRTLPEKALDCAWQPTFAPEGVDGTIHALAEWNGDLVVGGDFTYVFGEQGALEVHNVALWDGSQWSALTGTSGTGTDGPVESLAVWNGDLVVGGTFASAGGAPAANVAVWNGTDWSALGAGADGTVRTLHAHTDGDLYAGGDFVNAGGVLVDHVARWDGVSWFALGSGADDPVYALASFGGDLYAGGSFQNAGGTNVKNVARWNGAAWSAIYTSPGLNGTVDALAAYDDGGGEKLYVGGQFSQFLVTWDGGTFDTAFHGGAVTVAVGALGVHDGALFVGGASSLLRYDGAFGDVGPVTGDAVALLSVGTGANAALVAAGTLTDVGGLPVNGLARWRAGTWLGLSSVSGIDGTGRAVVAWDDGIGPGLVVGGLFTQAGGLSANNVARWDGSRWSTLGAGLDGEVLSLAVWNGDLYAGGNFTIAGGVTVNYVARWNGVAWEAVPGQLGAVGTDGPVHGLAVYDDGGGADLYATGAFTNAGDGGADYVARWDGSDWSALAGGLNQAGNAILAWNGDLYVTGEFNNPGQRIAAWDGAAWSSIGGLNNSGYALAVYNDGGGDALYVGGLFTQASGVNARRLARYDGLGGWTDVGTGNANGAVRALAVHDDGGGAQLYAGGSFGSIGGLSINGLAAWDGAAWSDPGAGEATVYALTVWNDGGGPALAATGDFVNAAGVAVHAVTQLRSGTWSAFAQPPAGAAADDVVRALVVWDDGGGAALFVTGDFLGVAGVPASRVARWDGAAWSPLGTGLDGNGHALAVYDDGGGEALYVGGDFLNAGGVLVNRVARWDGVNWSALGSGVDAGVRALAVYDDGGGADLHAGGSFLNAGGSPANRVASWNGATWSALSTGIANGEVRSFAVFDDGGGADLYAGGSFTSGGGSPGDRVAQWNGAAWSAVGSGADGDVNILAVYDDGDGGGEALYAGGSFANAGGSPATNVAEWNGTDWSSLGLVGTPDEGTDAAVHGLAVYDDGLGSALYVLGEFTTAGAVAANRAARWNGGNWSAASGPLGNALAGGVLTRGLAATVFNPGAGEGLFVGGDFATAGGLPSLNAGHYACGVASAADLGVSVTGPGLVVAGSLMSYTIQVVNNGPEDEPSAWLVNAFPAGMVCDVTSSASGGATGNTLATSGDLAETLVLPAGSAVTYTAVCTTAGVAGSQVSDTATVVGTCEDNRIDNSSTLDTTLGPNVDLAIVGLELSTRDPVPGENVVLTYKVVNVGTDTSGTGYSESFYLSDDPVLDGGDLLLGTSDLRAAALAGGGGSLNATELITIPGGQAAATYFLLVEADQADVVAEFSEDNVASRQVVVVEEADAVEWQSTGFMVIGRRDHSATLLLTGEILAAGGVGGRLPTGDDVLDRAELYDPATGLWRPTANLGEPRTGHNAVLLPSGEVLVSGGRSTNGTWATTAELYDPRTGTWTPTAAPTTARRDATATLLPDGTVLVAGGWNDTGVLSSVELFDPAGPSWTPAPSLATPRADHTASLLRDGTVLVVGGYTRMGNGAKTYLDSTEVFDGAAWTASATLGAGRAEHTASVLHNGFVLVTGGYDGAILASTESFNPNAPAWLPEAALNTPRRGHAATLVPNGQVVVSGGLSVNGSVLASEVFDPGAFVWILTGALDTERYGHTATLLPGGKLLVAGGLFDETPDDAPSEVEDDVFLPDAELYDPTLPVWDPVATLAGGRVHHTASLLPDGDVLVVGGRVEPGDPEAELYDAATDTWGAVSQPSAKRSQHTASFLADGRLLLAGGHYDNGKPSAELYDPDTGTWAATANAMNVARSRHAAVHMLSGQVMVAGGVDAAGFSLASVEITDGTSWTPVGDLLTARDSAELTLLASGKVLLTGGYSNSRPLSSVELYDPRTGQWTQVATMNTPRSDHTATLLPSERVLVTGGRSGGAFATAEVYDPVADFWVDTGSMSFKRYFHSATLLSSGRVLVVGGQGDEGSLSTAEVFDPATDTWRGADALDTPRFGHTATLLASNAVLVTGGGGSPPDSQRFDRDPPSPDTLDYKPVVSTLPATLEYGVQATVTGSFNAGTETHGGGNQASSFAYPVVELRGLDDWRQVTLPPDADLVDFSSDPMTLNFSELPAGLRPGPHLLTVTTAGVPSDPQPITVVCSLLITQDPVDATVLLGETASFSVEAQGALDYQWYEDGQPIAGATGQTYVTPPVNPVFERRKYHVEVSSGCTTAVSAQATLRIEDNTPPGCAVATCANPAETWPTCTQLACATPAETPVAVADPNGGEIWPLSQVDPVINSYETISWSMSDDVRICRVELQLLSSEDGGATYNVVDTPQAPSPMALFEPAECVYPGLLETNSVDYLLPSVAPSGQAGSIYKIRLAVTDSWGNTTVDESDRPFFIFEAEDTNVKSLVVWHRQRMKQLLVGGGETPANADARLDALEDQLNVLVTSLGEGTAVLVNLADVTGLGALYAAWDAARGSGTLDDVAVAANSVLFATNGVHDYLQGEWYSNFPALENLVLVGDDRVIPMARMVDGTGVLNETTYADGSGLSPNGTTVGEALAAGRYLSDDPVATTNPLDVADMSIDIRFVPEIAVGRLVETPEEIVKTVTIFIENAGVLELHEGSGDVLVAGYDFLVDAANSIAQQWSAFSPATLITDAEWDALGSRTDTLRTRLCVEQPSLVSLNGHATHDLLGVPSLAGTYTIEGLGTGAVDNQPAGECTLAGSVVYSVGCHGALPVAGSTAGDNVQDVAQTMLNAGALAYVGNTGYGWGLKVGVGYSEALVSQFTTALREGGGRTVGDAVRLAKDRYDDVKSSMDVYDKKVVMQWTLFGLPMLQVKIVPAVPLGTADLKRASQPPERTLFAEPPRTAGEMPESESFGPVTVERWIPPGSTLAESGALVTPPDYVTRISLSFDFRGPGVYRAFDADGNEIALDAGLQPLSAPQCTCATYDTNGNCAEAPPAGVSQKGCYYALNNVAVGGDLSSGKTDQPLQPLFVFDSRLSGTSFHGYLWMGSEYVKVPSWAPIYAQLDSNLETGDELTDRGSLAGCVKDDPDGSGTPGKPTGCESTDDEATSLVVYTGELVREPGAPNAVRITRVENGEILYFNNTADVNENCDREGPVLPATGYDCQPSPTTDTITVPSGSLCAFLGTTVRWEIPTAAIDDVDKAAGAPRNGVWRAVVVYTDDGSAQAWRPLELEHDGTAWVGEAKIETQVAAQDGATRLEYLLQAVDFRGNVRKKQYAPPVFLRSHGGQPASGVAFDNLQVTGVFFDVGTADVGVTLSGPGASVDGLQPVGYTVSVTNWGADRANVVDVSLVASGLEGMTAGGNGWTCSAASASAWDCTRPALVLGAAPSIRVFATTAAAGTASLAATVGTESTDTNAANDTASVLSSIVAAPQADLTVNLGVTFAPDESPIYTVTVANNGPDGVVGAGVLDVFPAELTAVSWTCAASGGATCTASGSGHLVDTVDLPVSSSVTYTVTTTLVQEVVLINTVTVTEPDGILDPNPLSNSATLTIDYVNLFVDGFESGDTSRWSRTVP